MIKRTYTSCLIFHPERELKQSNIHDTNIILIDIWRLIIIIGLPRYMVEEERALLRQEAEAGGVGGGYQVTRHREVAKSYHCADWEVQRSGMKR